MRFREVRADDQVQLAFFLARQAMLSEHQLHYQGADPFPWIDKLRHVPT